MRVQLSILAAAAAIALTACASATAPNTTEPASRDCFRNASITAYGVIDDYNVRVSIGPNRHYILTTDANARQFDWSRAISLDGPDYICTGPSSVVYLMGGDNNRRFRVVNIERQPDETLAGS